jgi:NitT/TauT family transport system permease protein
VGRELNDMSQVLAVMFVIAAISITVDKLVFGKLETRVKRDWGLLAKY